MSENTNQPNVLLQKWKKLRRADYSSVLTSKLCESTFISVKQADITHIRTAHYAVFRVTNSSGDFVARVGIAGSKKYEPCNTGFMGTAISVNHDQNYEFTIGQYLSAHGAQVIAPYHYEIIGEFDILWLPYVHDENRISSCDQWVEMLLSLRNIPDPGNIQFFNNYKKSMQRLTLLPDSYAKTLKHTYETLLQDLFAKTTRWGIVHGDLHRQNVIRHQATLLFYDLDTVSWAPQVWDLTHLALRAGKNGNVGYEVDDLRVQLGYTNQELAAAIELRSVASEIANAARASSNVTFLIGE